MTELRIVTDPRLVKARQLTVEFWKLKPTRGPRRKVTRAVKIAHAKQLEILRKIGTLGFGDAFQFVMLYRGESP